MRLGVQDGAAAWALLKINKHTHTKLLLLLLLFVNTPLLPRVRAICSVWHHEAPYFCCMARAICNDFSFCVCPANLARTPA